MRALIFWAIAIGFIFFIIQSDEKDRAALQAELNKYNSNISYYINRTTETNKVNIQGGVITIDLDKNEVTSLFKHIKPEYQPTDPSNVNTAIAYRCSQVLVGNYTDNSPGYRQVCDIYLVDVNKHSWSFVGKFNGSEPPNSKKGSGDRQGSNPVIDYLKTVKLK